MTPVAVPTTPPPPVRLGPHRSSHRRTTDGTTVTSVAGRREPRTGADSAGPPPGAVARLMPYAVSGLPKTAGQT